MLDKPSLGMALQKALARCSSVQLVRPLSFVCVFVYLMSACECYKPGVNPTLWFIGRSVCREAFHPVPKGELDWVAWTFVSQGNLICVNSQVTKENWRVQREQPCTCSLVTGRSSGLTVHTPCL